MTHERKGYVQDHLMELKPDPKRISCICAATRT